MARNNSTYKFQSCYFNKIGEWNPVGGVTTAPLGVGIPNVTADGTATARTITGSDSVSLAARIGYVSAATAGSLAGYRHGSNRHSINTFGQGGFEYLHVFAPICTVSDARMFCGLRNLTTTPTNVQPDTLVNCIGVGKLSGSTNMHVIHNDGAGTATTIDLGSSFPTNNSTDLYKVIFRGKKDNTVDYIVENISTLVSVKGNISTNLPSVSTLLNPTNWICNNATAVAVALDLAYLRIEQPYGFA